MTLMTGKMGGGKSYWYVNAIADAISSEKYNRIYTNIDGFKYELFLDVLKYSHKDLMKIITECYRMNVEEEQEFDTVLDYLIDIKFLKDHDKKVWIIIDEAHNYFSDRSNKLLMWFISSHRHLHIDLDFITQSRRQINSSYLLDNIHIEALPPSKQAFDNMLNYNIYSGNDFMETKHLIKKQEIFRMYKSGDRVESKNIFTKYIKYLVLIVFVFVAAAYQLMKGVDNIDTKVIQHVDSNLTVDSNNSKVVFENDNSFKSSKIVLHFIYVKDLSYYRIEYLDSYAVASSFEVSNFLKEFDSESVVSLSSVSSVSNFKATFDISSLDYFNFKEKEIISANRKKRYDKILNDYNLRVSKNISDYKKFYYDTFCSNSLDFEFYDCKNL